MTQQRRCENPDCRTTIWGGARKRFCLRCSEARQRDAKRAYELVRPEASERLHRKYLPVPDLSAAEIEAILARESLRKKRTGWRPADWP